MCYMFNVGQRRRHWTNIDQTSGQRFVFARYVTDLGGGGGAAKTLKSPLNWL